MVQEMRYSNGCYSFIKPYFQKSNYVLDKVIQNFSRDLKQLIMQVKMPSGNIYIIADSDLIYDPALAKIN